MNPNENVSNPQTSEPNDNWRQIKKIKFWSVISIALIIILGILAFKIFYKAPTCLDGIQNGTETGVDCGGVCEIMCKESQTPLGASWVKVFGVGGNKYFYAVDITNKNQNSEIKYIGYNIKIFDGTKIIQELKGHTKFLPSERKILSGQFLSNIEPTGTTIEFDDNFFFSKSTIRQNFKLAEDNYSKSQSVNLDQINIDIQNSNTSSYENFTANIIIYDSARNPVTFSKTSIDQIPALGEKQVYFTWPKGTLDNMQTYEIIYQQND